MTPPNVTESLTVQPAARTAVLIPFPARPKPAAPDPRERLALALASLNTALADQRSAIAGWRDVLGELKATTEGLDDSLQRYRANLRTLGHSVASLRTKAKALEAWADGLAPPAT